MNQRWAMLMRQTRLPNQRPVDWQLLMAVMIYRWVWIGRSLGGKVTLREKGEEEDAAMLGSTNEVAYCSEKQSYTLSRRCVITQQPPCLAGWRAGGRIGVEGRGGVRVVEPNNLAW